MIGVWGGGSVLREGWLGVMVVGLIRLGLGLGWGMGWGWGWGFMLGLSSRGGKTAWGRSGSVLISFSFSAFSHSFQNPILSCSSPFCFSSSSSSSCPTSSSIVFSPLNANSSSGVSGGKRT